MSNKKQLEKEMLKTKLVEIIKTFGLQLSFHSRERMVKRGYIQQDIARVLLTGRVLRVTNNKKGWKIELLGYDSSNSPCKAVFGFKRGQSNKMVLITIMPPIHIKYFRILKQTS